MRLITQELRAAAALLVPTLLYTACGWFILEPFGRTASLFKADYGTLVLFTWFLAGALILIAYLIHMVAVRRPKRPLLVLAQDIRAHILTPDKLIQRLTPLLMLALLLNCYTAIKTTIPQLQPFAYDVLFTQIDRAIFGTDPWRLTHAVFGSPLATSLLQFAYNYWFFLMWLSVIYAAVKTDLRALRIHYMLAFLLTWALLGSLAAVFLSSAGPCYYGYLIDGPNPFEPLMARLGELDAIIRTQSLGLGVTSLELQDTLWQEYVKGEVGTGSGISAMPSLHVAVAVLMARAGFELNRKVGYALSAFAVVIWIGSVHLGWHYALDGMVSAPLVLIIWSIAGRVVAMLNLNEDGERPARELAEPGLAVEPLQLAER